MSEKRTLRLKVVGENTMHCAGCESTVEFTLRRMPGVLHVRADHREQTIELELESGEPDGDQISAALDWIGYQVVNL